MRKVSAQFQVIKGFLLISLLLVISACHNDSKSESPPPIPIPTPIAIAGEAKTEFINQRFALDGTKSSDAATNNPLTYNWSLVEMPNGTSASLIHPDTATPSFIADKKGEYKFSLTVSSGEITSDADYVVITVLEVYADAGKDQQIKLGAPTILDGSHSASSDKISTIEFDWHLTSQPSTSTVTFVDANKPKYTFSPDVAGDYEATLTVKFTTLDGIETATDSVKITVTPPEVNATATANAGTDQSVVVGETVHLNGSQSFDSDQHPLTYQWAIKTAPKNSVSKLSSTTDVSPTFVPDLEGIYTFELIVHDGNINSEPDLITVTANVVDTPPVAKIIGPLNSTLDNKTIKLDGSQSSDADNDPLTYKWHFKSLPTTSKLGIDQLGDNAVVLFVADVAGQYTAELIVNDGKLDSPHSSHTVTVTNPVVIPVNNPPKANAGVDEQASVGTVVKLDGSASKDVDGDNLTFSWQFVSKPTTSSAVLIDNPNPAIKLHPFPWQSAAFTADVAGEFVIALTVNDGKLSNTDNVLIKVINVNAMPVAKAGADHLNVSTGNVVHIDGSASYDNDHDPLTYQWQLLKKPTNSASDLSNTNKSFDFTPDAPGEYIWQLVVSDGKATSTSDNVTIHAVSPVVIPDKTKQLASLGLDQHDAAWLVANHETEVDYVLQQSDRILGLLPSILDSMFKPNTDPAAASFIYSTVTNWDLATQTRLRKIMGRIAFAVNTKMFQDAFDLQVSLLDSSHQGNPPAIPFPNSYASFKKDSNDAAAQYNQNYQFFIASDTKGVAYGIQGLLLIVEQDMMGVSMPGSNVKGWEVNGAAPLVFHELTHSFGYAHDPNTSETTLKPNNIPYFVQIILGYTAKDILGTYCGGDVTCPKPNVVWGNPDSVLTQLFSDQ